MGSGIRAACLMQCLKTDRLQKQKALSQNAWLPAFCLMKCLTVKQQSSRKRGGKSPLQRQVPRWERVDSRACTRSLWSGRQQAAGRAATAACEEPFPHRLLLSRDRQAAQEVIIDLHMSPAYVPPQKNPAVLQEPRPSTMPPSIHLLANRDRWQARQKGVLRARKDILDRVMDSIQGMEQNGKDLCVKQQCAVWGPMYQDLCVKQHCAVWDPMCAQASHASAKPAHARACCKIDCFHPRAQKSGHMRLPFFDLWPVFLTGMLAYKAVHKPGWTEGMMQT
eukprot:scaffold209004_cov21-Tisochrysis_lutea.AAC.1